MTKTCKLISWNANSIRKRMECFKHIVKEENPDIFCIQEVKAKNEDFPYDDIKNCGFENVALYGMPGYNGVAICSKEELIDITMHNWVGKKDARNISAKTATGIVINNLYVPAGGDIPDPILNLSFAHKLSFLDDISEWLENNKNDLAKQKMILCGDFNIAPLENDVWSHKQCLKIVSHTSVEVERLKRLQESVGFVDVFRKFYPEPQKLYSWWSYRNPNWKTNDKGRRLDHIWVTPAMEKQIISAKIMKNIRSFEQPSDHVPLVMEFIL